MQGHLLIKLELRSATTAVIGLGYIGLPLLVEFARAGFCALGNRSRSCKKRRRVEGESYIPDVPESDVSNAVKAGKLRATADFSSLREADTINICVPTLLHKTKDPDLSFVVSAVEQVAAAWSR